MIKVHPFHTIEPLKAAPVPAPPRRMHPRDMDGHRLARVGTQLSEVGYENMPCRVIAAYPAVASSRPSSTSPAPCPGSSQSRLRSGRRTSAPVWHRAHDGAHRQPCYGRDGRLCS